MRALLLVLPLALAGCTHVVRSPDGSLRVFTFGTSEVTITDGRTTLTAHGDGTNVFGIVAKIVDAARRFFGGGDTIIQTAPAAQPPAPPAAPPSPRWLDQRWEYPTTNPDDDHDPTTIREVRRYA